MSLNDLLQNEDVITTKMGAAFLPGNRVRFREKDLHSDACNMSWMELYVYGITGREFTKEQIEVLNYIWTTTSYPEPRIWNNRVVAIGGSVRSTSSLIINAGLVLSEAKIYGITPFIKGLDLLKRVNIELNKGKELENIIISELKNKDYIYGYGRPIANPKDERIFPMIDFLKKHNLSNGKNIVLAIEIGKILWEIKGIRMNIAAIYNAIAADFNFSIKEYQLFMFPIFLAGMSPCYINEINKIEGAFLPTRCKKLFNKNTSRRKW